MSGIGWWKPLPGGSFTLSLSDRTSKEYYRASDTTGVTEAVNKAHNDIKNKLFETVSERLQETFGEETAIYILDIGYGRGGDIGRYNKMHEKLHRTPGLCVIGLEHNWNNLHDLSRGNHGAYARYLAGSRGRGKPPVYRDSKWGFHGLFIQCDCRMKIHQCTQGAEHDDVTDDGFVGRRLTRSRLHYDVLRYLCHGQQQDRESVLTQQFDLSNFARDGQGALQNKCHVVNIMFAVTNFHDDASWKNLMTTVNESLVRGGILVMTVVCVGDWFEKNEPIAFSNVLKKDRSGGPIHHESRYWIVENQIEVYTATKNEKVHYVRLLKEDEQGKLGTTEGIRLKTSCLKFMTLQTFSFYYEYPDDDNRATTLTVNKDTPTELTGGFVSGDTSLGHGVTMTVIPTPGNHKRGFVHFETPGTVSLVVQCTDAYIFNVCAPSGYKYKIPEYATYTRDPHNLEMVSFETQNIAKQDEYLICTKNLIAKLNQDGRFEGPECIPFKDFSPRTYETLHSSLTGKEGSDVEIIEEYSGQYHCVIMATKK